MKLRIEGPAQTQEQQTSPLASLLPLTSAKRRPSSILSITQQLKDDIYD